jgi:phage terminase large subunit-like protein
MRDETIEELVTRLYNHALDVVERRKVTGQSESWACDRFLKDISLLENEDCPFYFDADELYKFYKWSRLFKYFDGIHIGEQLILTDFHLFICANILCWKLKVSGYRKFKKVYIQTARKQWKTGIVALLSSYLGFNGKGKKEIYIAGWVKDQSNAGFNQLKTYFENCPFLKGKYTPAYGKITHIKSESFIQPLSHEARKTGDSSNPDVYIVDEYHNHETTEIVDSLWTGMKLKPNRLGIIITTAGFNLTFPCYKEYERCKQILDPNNPIVDDEYFVMICELDKDDDYKDESVWIKCNPLVATFSEGMDALRYDLKQAVEAPDLYMRSYLTKTLNIWINKRENGYMDLEKWKKCENKNLKLEQFQGQECIVGVDLSSKIDLTSVCAEFKKIFEDKPKYFIFSHSFIPQEKLEERIKTDKQNFDIWEKNGWLTTTPGSVVDYNYIKKWIHGLKTNFKIQVNEICFDTWNSTSMINDLQFEGFKNKCIEVPQTMPTLTGPTKDFREQVYMGNVEHDGNPVLGWAMGNAVTIIDTKENIMLDKSKSIDRIDPVAAIIDSHHRTMNVKVKPSLSYALKEGKYKMF